MEDLDSEKIRTSARRKRRLPRAEPARLPADARDLYAFERGLYEHALEPHLGIADKMTLAVRYADADRDVVADMIRTRLEDGDDAAEWFLDATGE